MIKKWLRDLKMTLDDIENNKYYTDGNVPEIIKFHEEKLNRYKKNMTKTEIKIAVNYINEMKRRNK